MRNKSMPDHGSVIMPPSSDLPAAAPPPHTGELILPPEALPGGLDNIPEETLSANEQVQDELDHEGLDIELPGEDRCQAAPQKELADTLDRTVSQK